MAFPSLPEGVPPGFMTTSDAIAQLHDKYTNGLSRSTLASFGSLPELTHKHLINWQRTRALHKPLDYVQPEIPSARKYPYYYSKSALSRIHRLYHYDLIRRFDSNTYKLCATLEEHRPFLLFLRRDPLHNPDIPLHVVAVPAIEELHREAHGIFFVLHAGSIFGGDANCVAICACVDTADLALYVDELTYRLRKHGATASVQWRPLHSLVINPPVDREVHRMRALVVMTSGGQVPDMPLERLYEVVIKEPGVIGAALVFGDSDLVVLVEASDDQELGKLVLGRLRNQPGVISTRTYVLIDGYDSFMPSIPETLRQAIARAPTGNLS